MKKDHKKLTNYLSQMSIIKNMKATFLFVVKFVVYFCTYFHKIFTTAKNITNIH